MDILRNLKNSGFTFSKKYGQNFITDEKLLSDIADDAALTRDDVVLEVGAGAGTSVFYRYVITSDSIDFT